MPSASANPAIAALMSRVRREALPFEVLEAARMCLADWIAVTIGAGDEDAGRIVRKTVESWQASGKSSVLYGRPTAAPMAALCNGTLAHCLDFDDTHVVSNTHTSAPVWAATLALGEALDRSEDDILRAFVAGFEVSARVGSGLGQALTSRGFHATGSFGRIGAAAASAALLALDEDQIGHALGVAATQASGLGASFGTMAKPFHAGKAAMDGVLSAQLAADDFRGAPWILSASGGLDRAMIQDGSVKLGFDTSRPWQILHNSFKPYAACHLVHPSVDAGRKLGIDPSSIRRGRVFVSPLAMQITGGASGEPATPLAAKFDLRYCLALALHGHTLSAADFMEPWKLDPAIAATAVKLAPAADPNVGYAAARMEVDLPDGGMRTAEIATAKGHPANPMTWEDMRAKFEGLVARRLGNAGTAELLALVKDFGSGRALSQMQAILGRLAADAAPHGAQLARAAS